MSTPHRSPFQHWTSRITSRVGSFAQKEAILHCGLHLIRFPVDSAGGACDQQSENPSKHYQKENSGCETLNFSRCAPSIPTVKGGIGEGIGPRFNPRFALSA